jgi:hypothetical protein
MHFGIILIFVAFIAGNVLNDSSKKSKATAENLPEIVVEETKVVKFRKEEICSPSKEKCDSLRSVCRDLDTGLFTKLENCEGQ